MGVRPVTQQQSGIIFLSKFGTLPTYRVGHADTLASGKKLRGFNGLDIIPLLLKYLGLSGRFKNVDKKLRFLLPSFARK